ncbi:MAG: ATP-binding protein [Bacteroidota bacterium]
MKIDRLHIDGFGVFHDKNIEGFTSGINILYGPNEAGKSTLLDFIRFTLFEYPRFHDERRPPLNGGNHGGKLSLKGSSDHSFSIYRNGDGKDVRFEYNGEVSENLQHYRQLIGNASIDLYKNVYAITLDELMHVDQLNESGMEDRIFSMGMGLSGVDFGQFENELVQHADSYFKARGRTQILVECVNDIHKKEEAIQVLSNKLDDYNHLSEQKEQLQNALEELSQLRDKWSREKNKFADYSRAYEAFVDYKTAREQLIEMGDFTYHPLEMKDAYAHQKKRITEDEQLLRKLNRSVEQLESEREAIRWDAGLAEHGHLLDYLKSNSKLYEEAVSNRSKALEKSASAEKEAATILQQLGHGLTKLAVLELKGTFELQSDASAVVEETSRLQRQLDAANDQQRRLGRGLQQSEASLGQIEQKKKDISIEDQEARKKAEEQRIEWDTQFQKALQSQGNTSKSNKLPLILALIFLVAGGVLFAIHFMAAAIVTGMAVVSLLVVLFLSKNTNTGIVSEDPATINKKLESLKTAIEKYDQLQEAVDQVTKERNQSRRELEDVNEQVKTLKKALAAHQEEWEKALEDRGLPTTLTPQRMSDFLTNVDAFKRQHNAIREADQALRTHEKRMHSFEEKLKEIEPEKQTFDTAEIYDLIGQLEANEKAAREREQLSGQLNKEIQEREAVEQRLAAVKKAQEERLKQVGAVDEAAFYKHFDQQIRHREAEKAKENAAATIKTICGADQLENTLAALDKFTPSELATKKEATESEYETVKEQYDEMNRELASISADIRHILEPDEMYALQNERESLHQQLKDATCEWLSTKMALNVLNESKQRYEEERQPEVITQTREYFKAITENAYEDLRISLSEKHVSIIDSRGTAKTVEELSRGTREQLLLALRLGLIEEYEKNAEPLPVALDDIMVNFDVHRAENLADVLTDFARDRQVILFTCHEHTRDLFKAKGANVIEWRN